MLHFKDFIDSINLVDVSVIGNYFSWSNVDGSSRSTLDSFILTKRIIDWWKISGQVIGDKYISDDSTI